MEKVFKSISFTFNLILDSKSSFWIWTIESNVGDRRCHWSHANTWHTRQWVRPCSTQHTRNIFVYSFMLMMSQICVITSCNWGVQQRPGKLGLCKGWNGKCVECDCQLGVWQRSSDFCISSKILLCFCAFEVSISSNFVLLIA